MNRRALRRLACAGAVAGTVPTLLLLATVHASAAAPVFSLYALTSTVRATSTDGDLGATGGLTPLNTGSASVDAALDGNPSASVLARPIEPGTTYVTVGSQVPGGLPAFPQAAAAYPGTTPSATATGSTARVTQTSATGTATTAGVSQDGLTLGATTASSTLTAIGGGHTATAVADAYASGLDVLGVLSIRAVQGHATISVTAGGARTVTAVTTVGSVTVAGQAVAIDDTGVHAVGTTLPLGPTLAQLTTAANTALTRAGISVSLLQPIHTSGTTPLGNNAAADSGGLSVTITNPDLSVPGVGTANTATLTLGRVQLTEVDQPTVAATPVPSGRTGTTVPGSPAIPGTPAVPAVPGTVVGGDAGQTTVTTPGLAATPAGQQLRVAGLQVSPRAAIAALGGWQALTLGVATFAVLALRNRPEDEEEHLCPCPT